MGKRKRCVVEEKTPVIKDKKDYKDTLLEILRSVGKSTGVIIGTNAVMRLLEKGELEVVLLSQKACSAIYHALNLNCKKVGVPLISLEEKDISSLECKIKRISTVGVKKNTVCENDSWKGIIKEMKTLQNIDAEREQIEIHDSGDESEKITEILPEDDSNIIDKVLDKEKEQTCQKDTFISLADYSSMDDDSSDSS